jgi:hypothetical protein
MPKSTRTRATRRDRRKAKQSDFAREATANPRKKGHHLYEAPAHGTSDESATPARNPSCADGTVVHDFLSDRDLGIKTCRYCGTRRKLTPAEFSKAANPLPIPKEWREKAQPRPATSSERPTEQPPAEVHCRNHAFVYDTELGIYRCRHCDAVTK